MKRLLIVLGVVLILAWFGWVAAQATPGTDSKTMSDKGMAAMAGHDGKTIFLDNKCNMCHSLKAEEITKKTTMAGPPDLSDVGNKHDAAWITDFLTKKVDLNGKKHPKTWTGKDEDLKTLVDWLAKQKSTTEGSAM
jgi:cbb3-type cytochrome oxidase cytochrome c subunit